MSGSDRWATIFICLPSEEAVSAMASFSGRVEIAAARGASAGIRDSALSIAPRRSCPAIVWSFEAFVKPG